MKKLTFFYFVLCSCTPSVLAQTKYILSTERINAKSDGLIKIQQQGIFFPSGHDGELLVYQINVKGKRVFGYSAEAYMKILYDERAHKIIDSVNLVDKGKKILKINQQDSLTLFHGFYRVPLKLEEKLIDELDRGELFLDYQDIWVKKNGIEKKIESYSEHYYDLDINFEVESSGKYVVTSTYVSEYLRSTIRDSLISIYGVFNDGDKDVSRKQISCIECIKPQIVGNYLYYGKKFYYLRGSDAYDWKIYRAPLFDLSKGELLGEYIELLFVSPDGRYILGKKNLYEKETLVILDIANRKFQYVLGRDYTKFKLFYSPGFRQFAFDRENDIIYIEYPNNFPFNSIGLDAKPVRTSSPDDKLFWSKFIHVP